MVDNQLPKQNIQVFLGKKYLFSVPPLFGLKPKVDNGPRQQSNRHEEVDQNKNETDSDDGF